jgi:hypothetical protein
MKQKPKFKKVDSLNFVRDNIIFNFQFQSNNSKTGGMAQIFMIPVQWAMDFRVGDDSTVCFDCKFSNGNGCYVRKGDPMRGLISKVKSLGRKLDSIPEFSSELEEHILFMCEGRFIRFGAYGEPVLLGESLTAKICNTARGWTGYTHQWALSKYSWSSKFFMASVEGDFMKKVSNKMGFRTFLVGESAEKSVVCPASKEGGRKAVCADCLLCSGTDGKGNCNIKILPH